MDLLVVSGSGFLGQEVIRQAQFAGKRIAATFHSHASPIAGVDWRALDARTRDDVTVLVKQTQPAMIINTARRQTDWVTTADGGMHVTAAAVAVAAGPVYMSSDAVFSDLAGHYNETSLPEPITPYGAVKTAITGLALPPLSRGPRSSSETGTLYTRHMCTCSRPAPQRGSSSQTTFAASCTSPISHRRCWN